MFDRYKLRMLSAIKGTIIKSRLDVKETRFIVAYRLVILREILLLRGECAARNTGSDECATNEGE